MVYWASDLWYPWRLSGSKSSCCLTCLTCQNLNQKSSKVYLSKKLANILAELAATVSPSQFGTFFLHAPTPICRAGTARGRGGEEVVPARLLPILYGQSKISITPF
jgi:hypothetical protein